MANKHIGRSKPNFKLKGEVIITDENGVTVAHTHNTFTNYGALDLARYIAGLGIESPRYIAIGTGIYSGSTPEDQWALQNEVFRKVIDNGYLYSEVTPIAVLNAVIGAKEGVGNIVEIGLISEYAREAIFDTCDLIGNWETEGTSLYVDTNSPQQGDGCIVAVGSDINTLFNPDMPSEYGAALKIAGTDHFQFWYFIDDVDALEGSVAYRIGSGTDYDTNFFVSSALKASLVSGWNLITTYMSDFYGMTKVGNPQINDLVWFKLTSEKNKSAVEAVDNIRCYGDNGTMWSRAEFAAPVNKQWGEIRSIYWNIQVVY